MARMTTDRRTRAVASLRGLSVGDALGSQFFLPENRRALITNELPRGDVWDWTDDAEMACSIFAVLDGHGSVDQDALAESLALHHDFDRGYGPGVNRMLRLIRQEGGDWRELSAAAFDGSGSWGNGSAMRIAPLGVWFADDLDHVVEQATLAAEVTHRHPEGVAGSVAVAVAAALAAGASGTSGASGPSGGVEPELSGDEFLAQIEALTPAGLVRDGIGKARAMLPVVTDPRTASASLGNGREVSCPDTVPFALWVAARHLDDFRGAFWAAAVVGGDVDTNCAIVGGIVAARTGSGGIPAEWLARCEALPAWCGAEPLSP